MKPPYRYHSLKNEFHNNNSIIHLYQDAASLYPDLADTFVYFFTIKFIIVGPIRLLLATLYLIKRNIHIYLHRESRAGIVCEIKNWKYNILSIINQLYSYVNRNITNIIGRRSALFVLMFRPIHFFNTKLI